MIVAVENLTHRYGDRVALSGVSFQLSEGEIFGLLGPTGGKATICGHDVSRAPAEVRRRIGVVFQSQSLDKKLTVEENLRGQGHLHGMSGAALRERIGKVLDRLGLGGRRGDLVEILSGGLRRRVEIAKGLLHQPAVILMDEASTGLDPGARRELWQYILELREREGVTVLLTSHILDEADKCDRLVLLHEGRVVSEGSPAQLKARIGGDVVILETADPAALSEKACRPANFLQMQAERMPEALT